MTVPQSTVGREQSVRVENRSGIHDGCVSANSASSRRKLASLGLASKNRKDFDSAYWKLDNYVVVQGDLFSSAAVDPKYLVEIAINAKFKEEVIDLIWQIGNGYSNDSKLMEECFNESLRALESIKNNPEIASSKYSNIVQGEINELKELKKYRDSQARQTNSEA